MTIQVTSLINEFITLTTVPGAPVVLSPFQTKRFDTSTITSELSDLDTLRKIQVDLVTDEAQLSAEELASIKSILPKLAAMSAAQSLQQVFAQPDATGTWAGRPVAQVIQIPSWANYLTLTISGSGASGASGRRGAAGSGRAGGGGGQAGVAMQTRIALRDSAGNLLATTATLTCAPSPAGGAAVTTDNTDGNPGATSQVSSFVFNGVTYQPPAGGTAAPGGNAAGGSSAGTLPFCMYPVTAPTANNTAANVNQGFPSGITGPGVPGGSISSADALLTVNGQVLTSALAGSTLTLSVSGGDAISTQRGNLLAATGGNGGASSTTAAAAAGGNGMYGSGGGGGGASVNGFNSGAGGRGGAGWAILQWGT